LNQINQLTQKRGYTFFWAENYDRIACCTVLEVSDKSITVLRSEWGDSLPHLFTSPKIFLFNIKINNGYYLNKVFHINSETISQIKEVIEKK
tara:strand:- start:274 stop:549 length:276 start_codon:yes stop_codon:yes gene_type:complete